MTKDETTGNDAWTASGNITRRRIKHAAVYLMLVAAYYVLFQLFYNMVAFRNPFPYTDAHDLLLGIVLNFCPIFIISTFNLWMVFRLVRIKKIALKIAVDGIISYLFNIALNVGFIIAMTGNKNSSVDWAGTVFNNTFIWLAIEMVYYMRNFKRQMTEAKHAEQRVLQYRYDALKAQVNPHFLFNSLNILSSLVSQDPAKAKNFTIDLSRMFRYIMQEQDKELVALASEVDFLESYISVLETRYFNQLFVEIIGKENIRDHQIIPYTMQLLVENVTKHNVISTRHPMHITIRFGEDKAWIENPIVPKQSGGSSHFGLNYLTQLYAIHGKEFTTANDGQTFTATIPYII